MQFVCMNCTTNLRHCATYFYFLQKLQNCILETETIYNLYLPTLIMPFLYIIFSIDFGTSLTPKFFTSA